MDYAGGIPPTRVRMYSMALTCLWGPVDLLRVTAAAEAASARIRYADR